MRMAPSCACENAFGHFSRLYKIVYDYKTRMYVSVLIIRSPSIITTCYVHKIIMMTDENSNRVMLFRVMCKTLFVGVYSNRIAFDDNVIVRLNSEKRKLYPTRSYV